MGSAEQGKKVHNGPVKSRMANLELLRCAAMLMVVALHFLGKGELLGDVTAPSMGAVGTAAWVLEAFCIVAVNVYMLISGYFLSASSFKLSRLITLYLQIWMYSVAVGLLAAALGWIPDAERNTHYFLCLLFPVSMKHYWFMTAYVLLYVLLPLLGYAVQNMSKQQLNLSLIFAVLVFSAVKSVLPFRLEVDGQGYTCLWYVCVFLVAAYIRRFGMPFLEKTWHCACLYVGGCLALFGEMCLLRRIYLDRGSLGLILKVSYDYNHILVLAASVGLFGLFLKLRTESGLSKAAGRIAVKIAPYVLGVYLLHENLGLRYAWQGLFGADGIQTVPQLLLGTALAVICVFITGVIIEAARSLLLRGAHGLLMHWKGYRWLVDSVERADGIFKKQS